MNFNLALICTDGRLADARAFCVPSAPPPPANLGGVIGLQTQDPWEQPSASAGPETPAWGQQAQRDPRHPEDGQEFWKCTGYTYVIQMKRTLSF